jgi:predicted dehydrogenase
MPRRQRSLPLTDSLRVAIVGAGWAGSRHAEAIAELREVDRRLSISCFVDSDTEHLDVTAERFSVDRRYASLDDALSDQSVEIVDIATPHRLHHGMAIAAAEAGKHVIVEKPMAMDVDEATEMIDAAEANGVKLFVAENHSYEPYIEFLRNLVVSGEPIGAVTTASIASGFRPRGRYGYPGRRAWLADPDMGGTGTWMLHGIHTLAGVRRVFGEVSRIYVQEHKNESFERSDVEGTMSALLTMESGLNVSVVQSPETRFLANTGGYQVHGEKGSVRATAEGYEMIADNEEPGVRGYPPASLSSYAREFKAFADYVGGDGSVATTGYSERRTLAVIQAGAESVARGQAVDLRERFGAI